MRGSEKQLQSDTGSYFCKNVISQRKVGGDGAGKERVPHVLFATGARDEAECDTGSDPSANEHVKSRYNELRAEARTKRMVNTALFGNLFLATSLVEHVAACQTDTGRGVKNVAATNHAEVVL